ncbi:phage tail protein I [Bosea sp. MMO-172]|uniref:phage tail protein I n=1 Tax=Bosea sp. MMO-172 TaxID=3127885 RepID=UPI003019A047
MNWSELPPDTAGHYERVTMDAAQAELPIPLRQLVDPATTTPAFLPFVAVHEGVKLWFDDWSEARKRQIAAAWPQLSDLIGTRPGLVGLLAYVDATLVSAVAHPRRFVAGQSAVGVQPLQFPPFTARYLVKVTLRRHVRAVIAGRSACGIGASVPVSREPIFRAQVAATVSKGPATQYTVTFAHRRRPTFDEMLFGMGFDEFIDRTSL